MWLKIHGKHVEGVGLNCSPIVFKLNINKKKLQI